jgi:hypothetical protein
MPDPIPTTRHSAPRRPILLLVDVEPDARHTRLGEDGWRGLAESLPFFANWRRDLERATGRRAIFNWFLRFDPQIRDTWGRADQVVEACPGLLEVIAEHGDSCGVHPHLWRRDARRGGWYNELADPAWTAECLELSLATFARVFGRPAEACRFGDRWLDEDAVERARAAGLRYDLTVEPGIPDSRLADDPRATARLPDYRRAPRVPWQPAAGDYLSPRAGAPDPQGLWMIPLSTSRPVWRLVRRPPYLMRASRSPNLALSPAHVGPALAAELARASRVPLVVAVRAGDLARHPYAGHIRRTAAALARQPALARCELTDPPRALASYLAA